MSVSGRYEFVVVQIEDRRRDERLNAAVAIFTDQGLDVRLPRRLEKLRALSGAFNIDHIRHSLEELACTDAQLCSQNELTVDERLGMINELTPFRLSAPGSFDAPSIASYESWVDRLLKLLVEPEAPPVKLSKKRTRLASAFKAALREERVLARKGEGLSAHRVVTNVQIAEGLAADFVLKNGAMHVIETVDLVSEEFAIRKVVSDIAVSALVLEQARMTFGGKNTEARLVYEASSAVEKFALPSLEAAAHQGAALINWASGDDRRNLLVNLAQLADPIPTKKELNARIHASTQGRLRLN